MMLDGGPPLTNEMHNAVVRSPVGKLLDRLIREEVARGGDTTLRGGNVVQLLWQAFHAGDK